MYFRNYLLTTAAIHSTRLETANELLEIIKLLLTAYRKAPTEQLENQIRSIKQSYDQYKAEYSL